MFVGISLKCIRLSVFLSVAAVAGILTQPFGGVGGETAHERFLEIAGGCAGCYWKRRVFWRYSQCSG